MPLLIDIKSPKDKKLFTGLAKILNIKTADVSLDDMEDFALGKAIENGLKSRKVNKDKFVNGLKRRISSK